MSDWFGKNKGGGKRGIWFCARLWVMVYDFGHFWFAQKCISSIWLQDCSAPVSQNWMCSSCTANILIMHYCMKCQIVQKSITLHSLAFTHLGGMFESASLARQIFTSPSILAEQCSDKTWVNHAFSDLCPFYAFGAHLPTGVMCTNWTVNFGLKKQILTFKASKKLQIPPSWRNVLFRKTVKEDDTKRKGRLLIYFTSI